MGRVAAIAAERSVRGFGLAGALVFAAEDAEEIWSAWRDPPDDVDVVVLSAVVAGILGPPATTVQRPPTAVFAGMTGIPDALAPVRSALLGSARADAARIRAEADVAAERMLAAAREEADRIQAQATERGAADAATMLNADRSRTRRQARAAVRAARREGYESLRAAARAAVLRMRDDPDYPRLHAALEGAARRALGRSTRIRDADDGGVLGQRAGRRVDLSLTGFADRAVDACASRLEEPSRPEP